MTTDTVPQTVLFPDLFDKPLFAKFNQEQASSDGGAVLLKAAERVYGCRLREVLPAAASPPSPRGR